MEHSGVQAVLVRPVSTDPRWKSVAIPANAKVGAILALVAQTPPICAAANELEQTSPEFGLWAALLLCAVVLALYWIFIRWLRRRVVREQPEAPAAGDGFSPDELERYARHIVLREIGGAGQQRIRNSRVMVVGAGGLGSPCLLYLAAAGVGTIGIVDDDVVQVSNLQRQIIHSVNQLGKSKIDSAREVLSQLNPHVEVAAFGTRLDIGSVSLLQGYDVVLDGSDNFETRQLVNSYCIGEGIPLVFGAISQWEGQVSVFANRDGPCLACVFPNAPTPGFDAPCSEGGVLGALPGVIGSMMAAEAIKLIAGAGRPLSSRMFIFDALWGESRMIDLKKNPDCPVCAIGSNVRLD